MGTERYRKEEERLRAVLKCKRQELGIRQAELAQLMGKARTFVSKYEQGERTLAFTEALELCKWLYIDEMQLIETVRGEKKGNYGSAASQAEELLAAETDDDDDSRFPEPNLEPLDAKAAEKTSRPAQSEGPS